MFDQENATSIHALNNTNIIQSTCQVNFGTINNQPTQLMVSPINTTSSMNATFSTSTDSAQVAIIAASIAGGIGLCTILICIVGLIVVKNKRNQGKVRRGIFNR